MTDNNLITPKEYKSVEAYKANLKEQLMDAIGTAQAVMLLRPTPKGEKRKRLMNPSRPRGDGNPEFTYVEQAYVSETLDIALMMNWDLVVTKSERIAEECLVEGYIEARFKNGMTIKRHGSGGAVKRNNANQSWGDVYKSAISDLMKNCAARMGIARDLYRHEEKELEAVKPPETTQPKVQEAQVIADDKPAIESQTNAIATLMGLTPDTLPEELKKLTFQQAADKIRELSASRKAR